MTHGIQPIIASAFTLPLMGCATIDGAGEDLEAAGGASDEKAGDERAY